MASRRLMCVANFGNDDVELSNTENAGDNTDLPAMELTLKTSENLRFGLTAC